MGDKMMNEHGTKVAKGQCFEFGSTSHRHVVAGNPYV